MSGVLVFFSHPKWDSTWPLWVYWKTFLIMPFGRSGTCLSSACLHKIPWTDWSKGNVASLPPLQLGDNKQWNISFGFRISASICQLSDYKQKITWEKPMSSRSRDTSLSCSSVATAKWVVQWFLFKRADCWVSGSMILVQAWWLLNEWFNDPCSSVVTAKWVVQWFLFKRGDC
jgi:hypothetical protein